MIHKYIKRYEDYFYLFFRVVFGALFFCHGLMKFGLLGGRNAEIFSMFWFAGIIELAVGTLVVLGLFASYAAMLGAAEMVAAYIIAHLPKGISPFANGGELAMLYFAGFVFISAYGSGKISLDKKIKKA